jgi:hypothetical protein
LTSTLDEGPSWPEWYSFMQYALDGIDILMPRKAPARQKISSAKQYHETEPPHAVCYTPIQRLSSALFGGTSPAIIGKILI